MFLTRVWTSHIITLQIRKDVHQTRSSKGLASLCKRKGSVAIMKLLQKDIDVLATFCAGEPPELHRFRVKDRNDAIHVFKVGCILDISNEKHLGYDIWKYKCQSVIGRGERVYEMQFIVQKALWQLVKI